MGKSIEVPPFEMPKPRVIVNGEVFAGLVEVAIATDPAIAVEDFVFGRYDPDGVKVTYRFFLKPDGGEPVELRSGSLDWRYTAAGEEVRVVYP